MRGTQGFNFMGQAPMAELQIPPASVFPAIIAIQMEKIDEKVRDSMALYKKAVEETGKGVSRSEKSSAHMQKPEHQEVAKSDMETRSYSLIYFNPESRTAEVVDEDVSISYEDETEQVIEEALAQRSAQDAYERVANPLIREHVDEQLLKEIMDKIKIESPSPFGGGAAVTVSYEALGPKLLEQYGEKIIALELAEKRKLSIEERLAAQISVVDEAIKHLDSQHADVRKVVAELPPLSSARAIALFRKKRIQKKVVRDLLVKDLEFLKAFKGRFSALRVQDVLKIALRMKKE
ncbi:Uncharacterised protein [uncultured archaeon]|nr:Uncharacterised protein [uncultured archaeon]